MIGIKEVNGKVFKIFYFKVNVGKTEDKLLRQISLVVKKLKGVHGVEGGNVNFNLGLVDLDFIQGKTTLCIEIECN